METPEGFAELVAGRSPALLRTAYLLTGDWHLAEDLLQASLARCLLAWRRTGSAEHPEAYVRRVLVTTWASWWRRKWRGEVPTERLPEGADTSDAMAGVDLRESVRAAVLALPKRQRAVVVLRYFDDLSEAETAAVLGCSVGTVKSQASHALAKLRATTGIAALAGRTQNGDALEVEGVR